LAVKPQIIEEVILAIADKVHDSLVVISVAAGISTGFILSLLNFPARIIRAMPNAAAMVGASATALCKAGSANDGDLEKALEIFSAICLAVTVEEKMMNVVTGPFREWTGLSLSHHGGPDRRGCAHGIG
jgi:pyrroline-5-carboxylate reductase